ncbi:MAG: hypothetical protein GHCLOJNM_03061 [bacterium]|nr:hypothetical protein [bacterium]
MRQFTVILTALFLLGCQCRQCHGQTPQPTATPIWVADLTVTVTEQAEFQRTVIDLWEADREAFLRLLYATVTGGALGDATPEMINTAQHNRWFNPVDSGSFLSRAHMGIIRSGVRSKGRLVLRSHVLAMGIRYADAWVPNGTRRQKFLLDIARLGSLEEQIEY